MLQPAGFRSCKAKPRGLEACSPKCRKIPSDHNSLEEHIDETRPAYRKFVFSRGLNCFAIFRDTGCGAEFADSH